jgi:tetratricopeptide (TPR) repeat protein
MAFDFASDAKREKRIARTMMTMVSTINTTLVPKSGIKAPTRVRCVTCHHGVRKPEPLTDLLKATVEKAGVDAARLHYQELRARYYGTGAYDFSPRSLQDLAEWLVRGRSDADGAISVLHLSAEYDPNEAETFGLMGMIQATKGDKQAAIETLKHALELDPENRPAQELLKALQSGM